MTKPTWFVNRKAIVATLAAAILLLAGAWPAAGSSAPRDIPTGSINVTLHDLELTDQEGRKVKFESEVIGDKVAVIIPFYTTCTTSYPILVFVFTRLQVMLGERLGKEVVLISVSVDPRTDIPIRLKAFARRQKARPGWVFLTGERNNLSQVLWGAGVLFSSNLDEHDHIPITIVGSADGQWHRFHGFPTPEQLLAKVDEMAKKK